jgi:hypothetical protein
MSKKLKFKCNIKVVVRKSNEDSIREIEPGIFESKSWIISSEHSHRFAGNTFSAHHYQKEDSWIQGKILGIRKESSAEDAKSIIIFEKNDTPVTGHDTKWNLSGKSYY